MDILIAQSSEEFRRALALSLGDRYDVHVCADGREALELLRRLRPDILVLDLMLPELDGLSLLQIAAPEGLPKVLATTPIISPYIQTAAQALGVDYIMRTPCDISAVLMRLEDMLAQCPDIKAGAAGILKTLGFSDRQAGARCLPAALDLYAQNPSQALTKELYPAVGKLCDPKAAGEKVEKDIRYAIAQAWAKGPRAEWPRYFPQGKKPTNGEFLSGIATVLIRNKHK